MKRSIWFFLLALFVLLVVDPNLSAHLSQTAQRIPVYNENSPLRTNDDVETKQSASHKRIVIDPARGGQDAGYVSASSTPEKDLVMQLALRTGDELEKAGYEVEYTRWYDDVPACSSLEECETSRIAKAKELQADYILSISLNQDASSHRGFSVFTQPDNPQLAALGKTLMNNLQATSFTRSEGFDTDHYDSFPILRDLSVPSILLQMGYITNPSDYARLSDSKFQDRLAQAIAQSFLTSID